MSQPPLSELGRRVLASLPAWAKDEPWVIAEEGGPELSVRSHTLDELAADIAVNSQTQTLGADGPPNRDEVQAVLDALQGAGYVEHVDEATIEGITHVDAWRMTEAGFEAITAAPAVPGEGEQKGAAFIEFAPGTVNGGALG